MTVALALVVGFLAARLLLVGGRGILASPMLERRNHRDLPVPTAGGVVAVAAVLLVESGRAAAGALGVGDPPPGDPVRPLVLFACLGFGFLGLVDDLLGSGAERGFRGHLGALRHGRVTTGMLKLAGGAGVALVLAAQGGSTPGRRILADALLIALAANLGNLLDRAPGRTLKAGFAAWVPLAFLGGAAAVPVAVVVGAFAALARDDLRERLMLGDTGANVLGAVLGLALVLEAGRPVRTAVLAVLVAANVAAEVVSFSAVIARVPVLAALDRWGRRP